MRFDGGSSQEQQQKQQLPEKKLPKKCPSPSKP